MSKLKPYDKYQPVAYDYVAEVPVGWQIKKLKYISKLETGNSISNKDKYLDKKLARPYISSKDINLFDSKINYDNGLFIKVSDKSFRVARKDSILLCIEGGSAGRKIGQVNNEVSFVNKLCSIYGKESLINNRFLFHFFKSCVFKGKFQSLLTGMIGGVSMKSLGNIKVLLPPLETQNDIVSYLDRKTQQIQAFIQKKERLIELLEEEKKSEITRVVSFGVDENVEVYETGIPYYPKAPINTQTKKLKYLATMKGRIGFHGLKTSDFTDKGALLVTGTDFENNQINWNSCVHVTMERYAEDPYIQLKEGDFLITKDGTIGKTAIVRNLPYEASLNSGVMLVRSKKNEFLNEYLLWLIKSRIFDEFVEVTKTGSTVMHLYQKDFGNFNIPLPNKDIQKGIITEIDKIVSRIEVLQDNAKSEIEKAKEYQESLITQVVIGQLRVPTLTPEKVLN
jgi:type I restriction enzyme S subunit